MDSNVKNYRIDFFIDDDVISPKILQEIVDETTASLDGMFSELLDKFVVSNVVHSIKKPIYANPADTIDLIRLFFIGKEYDPSVLGGKLATRGLLPNVVYVLDKQLNPSKKISLISLVTQSFTHLYTVKDYNDEIFLQEYSELFYGLAVTHRFEIIGKDDNDDGAITSQQLKEAADQLDFAIGAIEDLRLNTTYEIISNLRDVSNRLKSRSIAEAQTSRSDFGVLMEEVVNVASRLMDAMENKKFAGLAVSGIIASVVGYIGTPAVTAMGLCLAYSQGPEMFKLFISKLSSRAEVGGALKPDIAAAPAKKRRAPRRKKEAQGI